MIRRIYLIFLICCFIILFCRTVLAGVRIWQIGEPNNSSGEFIFSNMKVIEYSVPQNWESLVDLNDPNYGNVGNWGNFPKLIYPFGEHENVPQEIKINFDYTEYYSISSLKILARSESEDPNIRLRIFKGKILVEEKHITSSGFKPYDFLVGPIGDITNDSPDENKIIIKSNSPVNMYIAFDYIALFSNDTDRDGVSDIDEGDCSLDKTTTCIPIKTSDPESSIIKIIKLQIDTDELGGAIPGFRDVRFLDTNALDLPEWLSSSSFFPYGFLGFRAEDFTPHDKITIQISVMDEERDQPDKLYPLVRFHVYQDSNNWRETDFKLLDEDTKASIQLYDNGEGDFDGKRDGIIETKIAISYPRTIDVDVEKRGCFVNTIIRERDYGKDL